MYWHVLICAIVWFPLVVMVICYSAIFWKLDRYEQKVLRRENPRSVCYKTKVAKMMFTVLIVFVLFRVPFTALIFIRNQMLKESKVNQVQGGFTILWYCSHYLMFCNAAINPLIYGLTNDNFKKAYRQTPLLKLFCRTSDKGGTAKSGQCVGRERNQRVNNMLFEQSGGDKVKSTNDQGLATERSSLETSTTSQIWTVKKANPQQVKVISTNLNDSSVDPEDYHVMEEEENHSEAGPVHGESQKIGTENFM